MSHSSSRCGRYVSYFFLLFLIIHSVQHRAHDLSHSASAAHYVNFVTHRVEVAKAIGYGFTLGGDIVIVVGLYTYMTADRHPGMKM